ncbi:MAG: R3H domain-containing nucleic acid-binding protein [Thermomicrobiales bacterium]
MNSYPQSDAEPRESEAPRRNAEFEITDDLQDLLSALPPHIADQIVILIKQVHLGGLIEIVLDLGRSPEARFQFDEIALHDRDVSREDLHFVEDRIGHFGEDNRAGIERTLHRISAIRNRSGDIVGLTCRIGRAVYGTIAIIADLVESGQSVLLLGRPGVGKTTMLRETARVLADELRKRVVIVDTSNEIAGDGDIPHPAIGRARRMQVPSPTLQHAVMIEAVENHMPEVVVIDEIGTELEAMAARTIAERGVQLIGTAHGNTLENLMLNPTLSDLIGGIQSVTLSDEEARRRGTQKSILERKAPPTFNIMVEIVARDEVMVHLDVAATVDSLLRSTPVRSEMRKRTDDGRVEVTTTDERRRDPTVTHRDPGEERQLRGLSAETNRTTSTIVDFAPRENINEPRSVIDHGDDRAEREPPVAPTVLAFTKGRGTNEKPLRIFPFGVSRNRLEQSMLRLGVPASIVRNSAEADVVMTLKNAYRQKPEAVRDAEHRGIPVYVLRSNTQTQMDNVLTSLFPQSSGIQREAERDDEIADVEVTLGRATVDRADPVVVALFEAEQAITHVIKGGPPASLHPQSPTIRRLQHELAERYNLSSRSKGRDPYRHVEIYRRGVQ